jgi:hypothetical protein
MRGRASHATRHMSHATRHTSHATRHTSQDTRCTPRMSPAVIDAQRFIELRIAATTLVEGGNEAVQLLRLRVCTPDLGEVTTMIMATTTMMTIVMMMIVMMIVIKWRKVTRGNVAQPQMKSCPPDTERKSCDLYQERTCMPCMRLRRSGQEQQKPPPARPPTPP